MNRKTKNILLTVIFIMIVLSTIVSLSYAFYVVIPPDSDFEIESSASTNIPACLSINILDTKPLALSGDYAIPIKDNKLLQSSSEVLEKYKYAFTITNNCENAANVKVSLAPLKDSTMPIDAVKYLLTEAGATLPKEGKYVFDNNAKALDEKAITDIKKDKDYDVDKAYELDTVSIASGQNKVYDLYSWIDYYEGDRTKSDKNNNVTMNKTFSSIIILSDYATAS